MSNCIDILKPIAIPSKFIDSDKLSADINRINQLAEAPKELDEYIIWWFLGANVTIYEDCTIVDGINRSGHTERDFNQLGHTLRKYCTMDMKLSIPVTNEFDGHETEYEHTLWLRRFK